MNKKALAIHVEMVLSFIIFVGFIIFLLAVFPVYNPGKSALGLEYAERGISDFVKMDVKYFTVVLNKTSFNHGTDCFCFQNSSQVTRLVAVNDNGEIASAYYSSGRICIKDLEKFHSVYSSPDFIDSTFSGVSCETLDKSKNEYLIGLEDDIEMASYNKTLKLIELYNSAENYEILKKNFGVPEREDFGFKVVNLKGEEILNLNAIKTRPAKVQVLARNFPVQIAFENGSFIFGMINVQEW